MKSFNIHKNDKEETEKPNEEVEKRMNISSQSTSYDEYEEDNTQKKFTKITRRSKFQKIPKNLINHEPKERKLKKNKKKKSMEKQEKSRAAAVSAETEQQKNVLIKDMLEEIRVEKFKSETEASIDEDEARKRKIHLEKTWHVITKNEQAFMEDALENKEEDEVIDVYLKIYLRNPIEINFKELDLTVKMPVDVDCYAMSIRGLWIKYDHYSDQGSSFLMPEIPQEYNMNEDLLTFCLNEYDTKVKIRHEQVEGRRLRLEEKKLMVERLSNPSQFVTSKSEKKGKQSKKLSPQAGRTKKSEPEAEPEPLPYLPTPDEIILQKEEENRKELRKLLFTRCEKTEINLRKYRILGGVYHIDLIYQPPQPKDMRGDIFLTTLQLPKVLRYVSFLRPYKAPPPAPDAERTPEVIEAEMKALEAAMEALVLVTFKLPESVLWFEPPLVAHWIDDKKIWSTQDVHDIKYNEEKQIITFRTGRLGIHGLAAFKFINLPFQSWELKPETGKTGGVTLNISAAIVQVEFVVRENLVCLNSLIGGTTTALQDLVGKYMKLDILIRKMRSGGCDLFPERDTFSYIKGLQVKHPIAEKHLQSCMGLLSTAYMFAWSRWNATVSARQIIIQIKELHGCVAKEQTNMMLMVTPLRTTLIDCTEVGSEFSDKSMPGEESKGSDPRVATCRGKLQNRRSKLNQEINKELRLRAGAENLFKATTNRKLKETVALELSFVNSNLQLLKEQLAELNSSVELYQNVDGQEPVMPMIPLGLKETKDIDFQDPFKDFILEHYSEDGDHYEEAIADLMETRQATRTPTRDASGIALLFRYYNQLYFIERRFFPPDRSLGIYFEWFDSLTGVPSCQRTVAFEKASILFNAGALYTQLGAKQDRRSTKGLDQAVDAFLRAAGTFRYIHENFTNAPSMDLGPDMLDMLVLLMLAQARECLFEKLELQSRDTRNTDICLDLAQEAAQVAAVYNDVHGLISREPVRDYVPESWVSLVLVKREHHLALAHKHCAAGLLAKPIAEFRTETKLTLEHIQESDGKTQMDNVIPKDDHERRALGRAHLRESLVLHEESQRLQRMCRELKGKQALAKLLKRAHDATLKNYNDAGDEDDLRELLDPPHIIASTKFQLSITHPDFGQHGVDDLFKSLGPVAIFSAKRHWTAPRSIQLQRGPGGEGFGFSVRGDAPVIIAAVDHNSLADLGGMKEGDFIVNIDDKDVKWASHEQVVRLIKQCGDSISLKLVTPMDRNYLKKPVKTSHHDKGSVSASSSSGVSSGQPSPAGSVTTAHVARRIPWNPFKKSTQRDSRDLTFDNVILR
ncbi:uncharacterized protein LOC103573796 isoform X4 [Microplitis demolitor]|uniref:uncharacterized protein LOC103573796 isoform X4 n=1 Tax=Microplitis demolitor TaxID=69319 RepID=UPI00235B62ED|nr:uncharacterized protein LOC103573796 isoform X4 [Microplitis demolitor]